MPKFRYDDSVDALYIRLADGIVARTDQLDSGTMVDVDESGTVLGVEILSPARDWPLADLISRYEIEPVAQRVLLDLWSPARTPFPFARPEIAASA